MFEKATAGGTPRRPLYRASTLAGSVALHLALVAAVVLMPRPEMVEEQREPEEPVRYFDLAPAPAPHAEAGAGTGTEKAASTPRRVAEVAPPLVPPAVVPDHIPVPAPAPALAGAGPGALRRDTVDTEVLRSRAGEAGGAARAAARGEAVNLWELPEPPRLSNPRTMAMVWSELYPLRLLNRQVEGEALVTFVIDKDGRVDPSTLLVVSTTHPEFGRATLRGARRLRFRPARVDGHAVRVRAMLPVSWVLPGN